MTTMKTCAKCGREYVRRDAGFLGSVTGCPVHSEYWAWGDHGNDPNTIERRAAIDKAGS